LVLLTGGGSADIKPLIRSTCVSLPDLVLHGLAVWAHRVPAPARPESPSKRRPQTSRTRQSETSLERQRRTARTPLSETSRKRRPVV